MISTLASRMRPKNLCDVIGQQHLVGENSILTKIVEKRHPFSIILYGNPGCGKTTIANALANDLNIPCRFFNAQLAIKKKWILLLKKLNYVMDYLLSLMKFTD